MLIIRYVPLGIVYNLNCLKRNVSLRKVSSEEEKCPKCQLVVCGAPECLRDPIHGPECRFHLFYSNSVNWVCYSLKVVSVGVFLSCFVRFCTMDYVRMYLSFLLVTSQLVQKVPMEKESNISFTRSLCTKIHLWAKILHSCTLMHVTHFSSI